MNNNKKIKKNTAPKNLYKSQEKIKLKVIQQKKKRKQTKQNGGWGVSNNLRR